MENISVVIPVGPDPSYLEYLPACIESVMDQQLRGIIDIILIDDSGMRINFTKFIPTDLQYLGTNNLYGYEVHIVKEYSNYYDKIRFISYHTPWNVGVADAFNFGISMSVQNLVFTLGSDDIMYPTCLEECIKAYDEHKIEGWYNVTQVVQSGETSWIPNNTAMVTKKLWEWVGGFPPSAGVGGCDAVVLSILMKHAPERIIQVKQGTPLCWLREGNHQDTRKNAWYFADEVLSIRNKETSRWQPKV